MFVADRNEAKRSETKRNEASEASVVSEWASERVLFFDYIAMSLKLVRNP